MSKAYGLNLLSVVVRRSIHCLTAAFIVAVLLGKSAMAAEVSWRESVDEAMSESARDDKPMLVMVSARWCGYCQKMLRQTFSNPAVAARVNGRFVPVMIDADRDSELVQKLKVQGMPTILIVAPDRRILGRISGFQSAAQLDAKLKSINVPEQNRARAEESSAVPPSEGNSRKRTHPVKRTAPGPA